MAYEVTIEREFCAAHAIRIRGEREPVHGHNWRVTLCVHGEMLDEDGLVVDFHELERALDEVLGPWNNANLNEVEPFDLINPSAELVAREIATRVRARMGYETGSPVDVRRVRVTEAPGCSAVYVVE